MKKMAIGLLSRMAQKITSVDNGGWIDNTFALNEPVYDIKDFVRRKTILHALRYREPSFFSKLIRNTEDNFFHFSTLQVPDSELTETHIRWFLEVRDLFLHYHENHSWERGGYTYVPLPSTETYVGCNFGGRIFVGSGYNNKMPFSFCWNYEEGKIERSEFYYPVNYYRFGIQKQTSTLFFDCSRNPYVREMFHAIQLVGYQIKLERMNNMPSHQKDKALEAYRHHCLSLNIEPWKGYKKNG